MQITRNSLDTATGPGDWFTGTVYIDSVATASEPSRTATVTERDGRVKLEPSLARRRACCYRARVMLLAEQMNTRGLFGPRPRSSR